MGSLLLPVTLLLLPLVLLLLMELVLGLLILSVALLILMDLRTSNTVANYGTSCIPAVADVTSHDTISADEINLMVSLPLVYTQCQTQNLVQLKNCSTKIGECASWRIIEATVECFSLAKMKFTSSPQVTYNVSSALNFEYSVTLGDYWVNLCDLGVPVCSRVCCANDLMLILIAINSLHVCEGDLCEDFPRLLHVRKEN